MTICEIVYAFGALFVACELCQHLNIAFEECGEMFEDIDWYMLPIDIQQRLPLLLNFTQQSFEVTCFGSIACDRDTFKSVCDEKFIYSSDSNINSINCISNFVR